MSGSFAQKMQKLLARWAVGSDRECLLCGHRVGRFLPYRGGWRAAPPLLRAVRITGSDFDHYECPRCGCNDRERHLLAYLRGAGLLEWLKGRNVLHFAPERRLSPLIESAGCARYIKADLFPFAPDVEKIDLLAIPYPDETFDLVVANHVLEHVSDDMKALLEIRRVLKPDGLAILQTPYSALLQRTWSDPGVETADARLQLYGQEDHVRLFGRDVFDRICTAGFKSRVATHEIALPSVDAARYGVNADEPFFLFQRR